MDTCERHGIALIGERGDEPFCPICLGNEYDERVARGEDPVEHSKAMFGIPASPETLRPMRREKVLTFRLDPQTDTELREVAQQKGIGPSTLARMWLLEGLERERKNKRQG